MIAALRSSSGLSSSQLKRGGVHVHVNVFPGRHLSLVLCVVLQCGCADAGCGTPTASDLRVGLPLASRLHLQFSSNPRPELKAESDHTFPHFRVGPARTGSCLGQYGVMSP